MKKSFSEYLRAIGIGRAISRRVEFFVDAFTDLSSETLRHLFVADQVSEAGDRLFPGLWLLSENYVLESENFVTSDSFELIAYRRSVTVMQFSQQNYAFTRPADAQARLAVTARIGDTFVCRLSATGNNCDFLMSVVREALVPNLVS